MMFLRVSTIPWILVLAVLASGCDGDVGPTEPGPVSSSAPADHEGALHGHANAERSDQSLGLLWHDTALAEVARDHSREMRDGGFVGHVGAGGRTLEDRLREAGIPFSMASENVVRVPAGRDPAGAAHDWLMGSPPHQANILNPDFATAGVGAVSSSGSIWFTQIFIQ